MSPESFKRKLTAILSADVKGYSRLMGENEAETVKTLTSYRKIMGELIQQHRGRVIDSPGDNILAEIASVVDAVQCSVAAQNEFKARNAELPENRRMVFRIGVNLGDVIEEEGRIYGDGVNIAARLEALADPGGICISKTAFDHIESKLPLGYQFLGEQTVKNIAKPVGAYKVLMEPRVTGPKGKAQPRGVSIWRRKALFGSALALVVLLIGLGVWNFYLRAPKIEPASKEKMAFPLPDKPSIAVLPFTNMSDDPKQEFFSDGITEEIINALCKVPQIFVIARNSSFTYKGKPVKIQQVAQDLGVNYVLEGSVRREENRIRITAQLIDALTGRHVFSERYDRDLKQIFATQDEIAIKVLTALRVALTDGEIAGLQGRGVSNIDAFFKLLEAHTLTQSMNKESSARARRLAEEALLIEPGSSRAYFLLASTHFIDFWVGPPNSHAESVAQGIAMAQKTIEMDPNNAAAYSLLGMLYVTKAEYDEAVKVAERGATMDPNSVTALYLYGSTLMHASRCEEAIPIFEKAIRLSPLKPPLQCLVNLSSCYTYTYRYDEAVTLLKRVLQEQPNSFLANIGLTRVYAELDRVEDARAQAAHVLRLNPKFSLESFAKTWRVKDPAAIERYVNALRKAGLPEKPPLPLPDKPSIAVLPFVNMSEDKSQEFFSDGLTEEIITALSKTPKLFVIARNSSFVYKGKPVNVQQVSRELGVKYVLEGSVRRSGDQLRITAQLIDATTGNHLWAERYDRELKEIFAIQDEITMKIISALQVRLSEGDWASIVAKGTQSLEAYLKILEGRELIHAINRDDNALARKKCEEAITLDPKSAVAYAYLGYTYMMDFAFGIDREESMKKAFTYTQKALSLDDSQPVVYLVMEFMYGFMRRHEEAIAAGEKAVRLAPGSAGAEFSLGRALNFACRDREALIHLEKAVRMNPIPQGPLLMHIGAAHFNLRNYEEAVSALKKALVVTPRNDFARAILMIVYVEMGRMEEARAELQEYRKTNPKPTPSEEFRKRSPWKDEEVTQRIIDAGKKLDS